MGNWARSEYENPDVFMPERFLNSKYGAKYPSDEAGSEGKRITYGFGLGGGPAQVRNWRRWLRNRTIIATRIHGALSARALRAY
jgi:hypothetical protein